MTDPLSISAGIAGLLTTADLVFRRTLHYVQAVKGAGGEISALSREVADLFGVLKNLETVAAESAQLNQGDSVAQWHHVAACQHTLEKVALILKKQDPTGDIRLPESTMRRLKWPFTKPATLELIAEIERHKSTLTLEFAARGVSSIVKSSARQEEILDIVQHIKVAMQRKQEAEMQLLIGAEVHRTLNLFSQLDTEVQKEFYRKQEVEMRSVIAREQERLLKLFSHLNPAQYQEAAIRKHHPGTGQWLLDDADFRRWLGSKNSNLWVNGVPGAGKTILASVVVEHLHQIRDSKTAIAYFFCSYTNLATQEATNILGSLAAQIARHDAARFKMLETFYRAHNPPGRPRLPYTTIEIRNLILHMSSGLRNIIIVIDGLDECARDTQSIVRLVSDLNMMAENIKTVFFSRREREIEIALEKTACMSLDATQNHHDIISYVAAQFETLALTKPMWRDGHSLKGRFVEALARGSGGM